VKYLILSDIHSNLQALDAVLADAERQGYDRALVLGDIVGYGGDPSAVLARTLALPTAGIIRGNHDKVCARIEPPATFGGDARVAIEWTASVLSPRELETVAQLQKGPLAVEPDLVICHGSPFDEDHYIFGTGDARRAMRTTPVRLCLFGHTHVPAVFSSEGGAAPIAGGTTLPLPASGQCLANIGSVGQPRDGDTRAAYGILDTTAGTLEFHRVPYDLQGAQAQIKRMGLPAYLAERLAYGR
jgi:diadenosine tetraphosphatase ApaH/serine/threonine PP2A family protein phosphatase